MYEAKHRYRGDIARTYTERRANSRQWTVEHKAMASILDSLPQGIRVLDIPVGTGRFLGQYASRNFDVLGMDISPEMLAEADEVRQGVGGHIDLMQGDAEDLDLPDGSVDCVVCIRFLNWVPFQVLSRVLGELSRVSRHWLVLEMRVNDQPGLLTVARRSAKPGVVKKMVTVGTRLYQRHLRRPSRNGRNSGSHGTVVHPEEKVAGLFQEYGLVVDQVFAVDEGEEGLRGIRNPMKIYVLRKDVA